jgi:Protein of unknown function (DUF1302)
MARGGRRSNCVWVSWAILAAAIIVLATPAAALLRYGPLELSGSVDSQTLLRSAEIDQWQFVQNRNTALLRFEYNWLQNGRFIDRFDVPFIKRSNLYLLYRGVYDSFWGIAPGGRQKGVTVYDDMVGGPIIGNQIGRQVVDGRTCDPVTDPTCICPAGQRCTKSGIYSSTDSEARTAHAFENTLREAYVDFALADAPLSFRLGRQQVIWGESDYFRLMDVINPLDTTWHLGFEEWDKLRIPLWLVKGIWNMGNLGPIHNAFTELVWNPGDFQPGNKVEFLPAPWAVPIANPVRAGQITVADPNSPDTMITPIFNLQGTSFRRGNFHRNPADASDVGVRFHGVTDIPIVNMQGFEFTINYLWARGRAIGASAGAPFGLKIEKVTVQATQALLQNGQVGSGVDPSNPEARFAGKRVIPAYVTAQFIHPYTHIFGTTANWFEGTYTNTVYRLEMAYQLGAPFLTASLDDRVNVEGFFPGLKAPVGYTTRDVWAGMIGFDRPTWIRFLNPRTTWFITGQFFWSYVNGTHSNLRGGILTASEIPYYRPPENSPFWNARTTNGIGQWDSGPYTGQIERTQTSCVGNTADSPCAPGTGVANTLNGNADRFLQWEMLTTLGATSFYLGGTLVPFLAVAIDPMNRALYCQIKFDYFLTNNLIVQLRENFFNDLGSGRPTLDPWGIGLDARRDETGVKITYQF